MRGQNGENKHPPTLAELLATPVNTKQVRRILEFCSPLTLFVEIDERGTYQIVGVPGVPGHFQLGTLAKQKEWTPTANQAFVWQTKEERGGYLHYVSRQQAKSEVVALVQHQPSYAQRGRRQTLKDINLVLVTPLWAENEPTRTGREGHSAKPDYHQARREEHPAKPAYQARHCYRCILKVPCTCDIYLSLAQTHAYQWNI